MRVPYLRNPIAFSGFTVYCTIHLLRAVCKDAWRAAWIVLTLPSTKLSVLDSPYPNPVTHPLWTHISPIHTPSNDYQSEHSRTAHLTQENQIQKYTSRPHKQTRMHTAIHTHEAQEESDEVSDGSKQKPCP